MNWIVRTPLLWGLVFFGTVAAGCGGTASDQLVDARRTIEAASAGEATRRAQVDLWRAERSLALAEEAEDGSRLERHYAYLADRQARTALSKSRRSELAESARRAERAYVKRLEIAVDRLSEAIDEERAARAQLEALASREWEARAEVALRAAREREVIAAHRRTAESQRAAREAFEAWALREREAREAAVGAAREREAP